MTLLENIDELPSTIPPRTPGHREHSIIYKTIFRLITGFGLSVGARQVRPEWFGATGVGIDDDTEAIEAAITYLVARGGGTLKLSGIYLFTGVLRFPNVVDVRGVGGGKDEGWAGACGLVAGDATARVVFGDPDSDPATYNRGGESGWFFIDGADLANPGTDGLLRFDGCLARHFTAFNVRRSLGDGVVVARTQNCKWDSLDTVKHMGDGLVLDEGAGGNLMDRVESNANHGWGVRCKETTGTGPYLTNGPAHNKIVHLIAERRHPTTTSSQGGLYISGGDRLFIDTGVFAPGGSTLSGALVKVDLSGGIATQSVLYLDNARFNGAGSGKAIIQDGGEIHSTGRMEFINCDEAWEFNAGSGSAVDLLYASTAVHWSGSGNWQSSITMKVKRPIDIELDAADGRALLVKFSDSAFVLRIDATGVLHFYDGTSTTAIATLGLLNGVGALGVGAAQLLVSGRGTTAARPAAAASNQGAFYFNTTTAIPNFSTGTGWVDATGAAV
jgi:hypothetical protein